MINQTVTPIFSFNASLIRINIRNNQIWFVARDVCKALGIGWAGGALSGIPAEWQGLWSDHNLNTNQRLKFISEPAVYKLAFRSNKPEADAFTNWVASEVLPSIRKTGKYEVKAKQKPISQQQALPVLDSSSQIESSFLRIRSLVGEIFEEQKQIYCIIRQNRGNILKTPDTKRHMLVNMHTTMDRLFYSLDYALEGVEAHAKTMCIMSELR